MLEGKLGGIRGLLSATGIHLTPKLKSNSQKCFELEYIHASLASQNVTSLEYGCRQSCGIFPL